MTLKFFDAQIQRLISVFGAANFHPERKKLIWAQVHDLPERNFLAIVNHFIGNHKADWPPLLKHFVEEAHAQRRLLARSETAQAQKIVGELVGDQPREDGLQKILSEAGAKSVVEAVLRGRRSS